MSAPGLSDDHPGSYMSMARRLAQQNEGWFDVNQYDNLDNPEGHYRLYLIFSTLYPKYFPPRTLGPEIWSQTVGRVTHFVAGGSTGGTISGTGRYNTGLSLVGYHDTLLSLVRLVGYNATLLSHVIGWLP